LSNDKFAIVRFVDWNAHHDIGHEGLSTENKIKAINEISKYVTVFILSECELPDELIKYKIKIPSNKMHDALYFSELLFGESSTMASECACLGTQAIFIDNEGRGYTDEQELKYGLVYNFDETKDGQKSSIVKAVSLLIDKELKEKLNESKLRLLSDKINPTKFLVWFIEEYPKSVKVLRENPDYQLKFK